MDSWHNHLANVIALHTRGKDMTQSLNVRAIMGKELSAMDIVTKMSRAEEIEKLYTKAYRMCKLLANTQDEDSTIDISSIEKGIHDSLRRIQEIKKILNFKAKKWGLSQDDIDSAVIESPPNPAPLADANAAKDNPYTKMLHNTNSIDDSGTDVDLLKTEVRASLKALMDVIDYMEAPTLLKLHKKLDKLVEY